MEINSMEILNPEISTTNDHTNSHVKNNKIHDEETAPITNPITSKPRSIKPPMYVHGNINHVKLLNALKHKYKNVFQAKYTSNKLKIMFDNMNSFTSKQYANKKTSNTTQSARKKPAQLS